MGGLRSTGWIAVLCLLAGAPLAAAEELVESCRTEFTRLGIDDNKTLLLGVPTGEHETVPPGEVIYYDRSRFYPEENEVPVRGYRVRIEAFHHPTSGGLGGVFAGSDSMAILVPWGCRGDRLPTRWDEAAGRWTTARESAVFSAVLRPVATADGTPIFDVYSAALEPYPTAKPVRDRISEAIRAGQGFLSAQEFFIFAASLPVRDVRTGALSDAERLRAWLAEHPGLAKRWPASETLEALRARGEL